MTKRRKGKKTGPKGRSAMTPEVLLKLEQAFSLGCSDNEACLLAGICPATLYNYQNRNPGYLERKALLKDTLILKSRGVVADALSKKDKDVAKWYLERKRRDEFSTRSIVETVAPEKTQTLPDETLSFTQFCEKAGYPAPFPKQIEMRKFGMDEIEPRLLLGARGYGKTDYVTVLGIAYEIYLDCKEKIPTFTALIVTKSEERNSSMLSEIRKACEANGIEFEKGNSTSLRVLNLLGKDHTVSSMTVGSTGARGRHPKLIVGDDLVTEEDISEATRKRVQRLYNELMKLTSNILIIGQPVHRADLYQTLRPLVKKLEVPHGSIPDLDIDLSVMELAGVSKESISASYLLKVIVSDFDPFERIKWIDDFPSSGTAVAFIDPSFEGGDYTALTIGKSYGEGVAIKGRAFKKAWNHCLTEMVEEMLRCGVKRVAFETNSLGDQPIAMLRSMLPDGIGVIGRKSNTNKHSRIMAAGTFAEYLHLAKTSDQIYKDQVTNYEYGSKHDDAPDSLASLLTWLGIVKGKDNTR